MGIKKESTMNYDNEPALNLYLAFILLAINDTRDYFRSIKYEGNTLPRISEVQNSNARSAIHFLTSKDTEKGSYQWMCDMLSINYQEPINSALDWNGVDFKRVTENIKI